jgi:hypothetical protein
MKGRKACNCYVLENTKRGVHTITNMWICKGSILNKTEKSLPTGRNKWTFRFRGRFSINKEGCFIFGSNCDQDGYAHLSYQNKSTPAHRLSWILINGNIPTGMCVCHSCDNPRCINPTHLFIGSAQENTADRNKKSRQAMGQKQAFCKLTPENVMLMREEHFQKNQPIRKIASKYGVCFATAREAINSITWGWLK